MPNPILCGLAYHVGHPRRRDQDFVTVDPEYVVKALKDNAYLGWKTRVSLIAFRGPAALPITTCLGSVYDALPDAVRSKVTYDGDLSIE